MKTKFGKAAKDVAASKEVLAELFERIGYLFKCLETYTEASIDSIGTIVGTENLGMGFTTKGYAESFSSIGSTKIS